MSKADRQRAGLARERARRLREIDRRAQLREQAVRDAVELPIVVATGVTGSATRRVPGQSLACGWCGTLMPLKRTGRPPKWCSDACRHRAWEQQRAAASGESAVRIVDRYIEVGPDTGHAAANSPPSPGSWADSITSLAQALADPAVTFRRTELDYIEAALVVAFDAMEQRQSRYD